MRIICIHSSEFSYQPKSKAFKGAEEIEKKLKKFGQCLVVFSAVETEDEADPKGTVKKAAEEIENDLKAVKEKSVVIYPWVHLTEEPSSAKLALEVLDGVAESLGEKGYGVERAPFGWYKAFNISCLGHPLAEKSRVILADEEKEKPKEMKGAKFHKFYVVDVDGEEHEITREDWGDCPLWEKKGEIYDFMRIFVRNELAGNPPKEKPKHIEYMRQLELLDYCPESDVGHMKWYPKGMLLFDLIHDYALQNIALPWGAFKMKNPLIYRDDVAEIGKLMGEFHERDYFVHGGNERFVLRFASDPGAFPFMQKVWFTYKQMPLKVYEEAICFRREQKGEVMGLRRMRNFHMTDMHAFCADKKNAVDEFTHLCQEFATLMDDVVAEGRWVLGWEGTEEFYEENKEWLVGIGKSIGVPAFFKLMEEMSHYYAIKNEYQVIGADEANVQVSTVQWDIKDGERFDICYVDEDGSRVPVPVIIHASSFGSIERTLYGILENAARDELAGEPPSLPLWLSPTQVRVCPVKDEFVDEAMKLAQGMEGIRVDVDDRSESVSKKVRDAETEWVPYVLVFGDREIKSGKLSVRIRETGEVEEMTEEELLEKIKSRTEGMPFRRNYLPMRVSQRPIFVG